MKDRDVFILLSNSTFRGQSACRYINNEKNLTIRNKIVDYLKNTDAKTLSLLIEESRRNGIYIEDNLMPDIYNAPKYLWAKGLGHVKKYKVSVIGARNCSAYGKSVAYAIGKSLAEHNIQVVSGMAYGVDVKAHEGALRAGGSTIAVLGSGVLNCYPKLHHSVYSLVQERGLILSEYGLYGKPLKHHFPFRNRIISGLSDVLIVVEAKEKSGTMITVNYALDQGKTIMAVPGRIDSELSFGTNRLIDQGARMYTKVDDVLEEIINFT